MSYNKSKLTSDNDLSISCLGLFSIPACFEALLKFAKHFLNVFEEFVLSNLIASPLMKPLFTPWRVARGKMCILQGFSRLIVGFDVQDVFLCESPSFENCCFKERFISLSDISAVNFIVGWNLCYLL